jgi:uncharacterized membrane protein SpoIIM required for sporulation
MCGASVGPPLRQSIMSDQENPEETRRDELLGLLSTAGSLAGLCITIVAFMNTFDKARASITIVDDMLAMCAAGFLFCIYLIFWALRSHNASLAEVLIRVVDVVFLLAITAMTIAAFIMIYTIW